MSKEGKETLQILASSIVMLVLFFVALLYSKQISYYFTFFSMAFLSGPSSPVTKSRFFSFASGLQRR